MLMLESVEPNLAGTPDKRIVRRFQYTQDICEWIRQTERHPNAASSSLEKDDYRKSWTLTKDFPEAMKLLEFGWNIADEINSVSSPIYTEMSLKIEREEVNYDVNGHYIDIARFCDGEPEAWGVFSPTIVEQKGYGKVLKIVINSSASCGVSAEVMKTKGILATTLVKLLEYAGYRCDVDVVFATSSEPKSSRASANAVELHHWFHIKAADQFLDESRMVFAMAHPSMLRRIVFALKERFVVSHEDLNHKVFMGCGGGTSSYGYPNTINQSDQGDIYIDDSYLDFQWTDIERCKAWVRNRLRQQGVRFKDE